MYLEKVAGLKKSIIQEMSFSRAKKVEAVKRHYYSCNNHMLTTSTQELRQPQTLFQPLQPPPPTQPKLMVIPWGGQTILLGTTSVSVTNTCPIDNSLMILHSLTDESVKIRSYVENNNELVAQTFCKSLRLVENPKYAEAKLEWIKECSSFQVSPNGIFDFWGNEENMFTRYLILCDH